MTADTTARLAATYAAYGLARRPHRVPRAQPPSLIEAEYAAQLVAMVGEWRAVATQAIRLDDVTSVPGKARRVRETVTSTVRRTQTIAERTARRTVDHSKRQVARQTKAALGVEVPAYPPGIEPRIQAFIVENVAAMQKLGNATADALESTLARAYADGWGADELAEELTRRFGIAERSARGIARDQMQRLYAQVTRMQHEDLGVTVFRWHTQQDGKVRSSHAVKDGRVFPYKGSRAPSFLPGEEPNCRCWAEPSFEEIKASARALAGKGRTRR